jgi:hypothetical protein
MAQYSGYLHQDTALSGIFPAFWHIFYLPSFVGIQILISKAISDPFEH